MGPTPFSTNKKECFVNPPLKGSTNSQSVWTYNTVGFFLINLELVEYTECDAMIRSRKLLFIKYNLYCVKNETDQYLRYVNINAN